ncbi:hypothetical protein HDU97_004574 [Phlyctochytrium planicorne]|nr:hypothetical protein HDU97_004574 [Phlyctochytrium planicorne]
MKVITLIALIPAILSSQTSATPGTLNPDPAYSDPSPMPSRDLCPAPSYCPASYAPTPVCGSDGQTYTSNCHLQQAICADSLAILRYQYTGSCKQEDFLPCPKLCPELYAPDPVCGSDGQTYTSDCHFRMASCKDPTILMMSRGQCQQPDPEIEANEKNLPCPAPKICPCYFADASICAVSFDGKKYKTYSSPCSLQQARCNFKSRYSHAYDGQCNDPKACARIACPKDLKPVCGSNGKTYANRCTLMVTSCMDNKTNQLGMTSYNVTHLNRIGRLRDRAAYDKSTIHAIIDSALMSHVSFNLPPPANTKNDSEDDDDLLFPTVIPMVHVREGDSMFLHGYVSSRIMKALGADKDPDGGVPVCITVTHLDGLVFALNHFNNSINYRSAVVMGLAHPLTDKAEKVRILKLFTDKLTPGRWEDGIIPEENVFNSVGVVKVDIVSASAKRRVGPNKEDKADLENTPAVERIWTGVVPIATVYNNPITGPTCKDGLTPPPYLLKHIDDLNQRKPPYP